MGPLDYESFRVMVNPAPEALPWFYRRVRRSDVTSRGLLNRRYYSDAKIAVPAEPYPMRYAKVSSSGIMVQSAHPPGLCAHITSQASTRWRWHRSSIRHVLQRVAHPRAHRNDCFLEFAVYLLEKRWQRHKSDFTVSRGQSELWQWALTNKSRTYSPAYDIPGPNTACGARETGHPHQEGVKNSSVDFDPWLRRSLSAAQHIIEVSTVVTIRRDGGIFTSTHCAGAIQMAFRVGGSRLTLGTRNRRNLLKVETDG
ncbi:hypothetical protein EDC04DRAFT_2605272 [Pisolithus marmoratus]|nr:hypothetical protein EDC04DRAFT_2605272 [Pisolithus marmoratus]